MSEVPYGKYELLRKIAAGGMAEIFLARQWGEGGFFRDVVIKRLFSNLAEHESALRMFQYEARLLAHLNHPNIPQVTDLGFAEGTWYMAMEYVQGWTVTDVWRAGARRGQMMPLPVTLGLVMQVCEALQHAHTARDRAGRWLRIVHRDVTPHNVMVSPDGVGKLMDFGVAKTDARMETEAGAVKGTFSYMSPEQVRGKRVDRRADVFSMGVILYELTTGTRLFRGNDMQVMQAVVETDAPRPSLRMPDYPADLEEIVLACLRRDREARIQSAADLALHLEHFAMRHGMLVGPRAIAHYVWELFPAERLPEEELALVQAPSEQAAAQPAPQPEEDWSVPLGGDLTEEEGFTWSEPGIEDAESLPSVPPDAFDAVDLDELLPPDAIELPLESDTLPPEPFAGFDDETSVSDERPVVLLDAKKKSVAPGEDDAGYLAELERRLSEKGSDEG